MIRIIVIPVILLVTGPGAFSQSQGRARDFGIEIGVFKTGRFNAIFAAESMSGREGHEVKAIPIKRIIELMKK